MHSFFFHELQLMTTLYELKLKVYLSKTVSEIFNFWFRFVFIKAYIFFNKKNGLFEFNSFQNKKSKKATHSSAPRPLIFKLQQKI